MAKPIDSLPEWSSDANYSQGPKIGRLTKTLDLGAALAQQGHIPGKNFPTTSNEFNAWLNLMSLIGIWTQAGSSEKTPDAHIVETTATGTLNARTLNVGGESSQFTFAAIFENNGSGNTITIDNNNATGVALRIDTDTNANSNAESIFITNDTQDFTAATSMIRAQATASGQSIGGIEVNCCSDLELSTSGIQARSLAGLNSVNIDGVAVEAVSGGPLPAVFALSLFNGVPAMVAGYNLPDATGSAGAGGNGLSARGGDGDPSTGLTGGAGVHAVGGDAKDGTPGSAGGPGVWAQGGFDGNDFGGPGLLAESQGQGANAILAQHTNTANSFPVVLVPTLVGSSCVGINVESNGSGAGLDVEALGSGEGVLVRVAGSDDSIGVHVDGTTNQSPAARFAPQAEPTNFTKGQGYLWVSAPAAGGSDQLKLRSQGESTYVRRTPVEYCGCSKWIASAPVVPGITLVEVMQVGFPAGMRPNAGVVVMMKAMGTIIATDSTTAAKVGLAFRDVTANQQIFSVTLDLASGTEGKSCGIAFEYTLPAEGPRIFSLEYNLPAASDASQNIALDWLMEVESTLGSSV